VKRRLSKVLAENGVATRRACEEIIDEGRVYINKEKASLSNMMVDVTQDKITLDGKIFKIKENKVYFALHKPKGYLCTSAPEVSRRVVDLIKVEKGIRLFTVGRLDKDTEGLIILTNDGAFAHKVMHPSFKIEKEYVAKVNCDLTDDHLKTISKGAFVQGAFVKPKKVVKVRKGTVKIVVKEGRKREVRHLIERAGVKVIDLKRIRIGGFSLGNLAKGSYFQFGEDDLTKLFGKEV